MKTNLSAKFLLRKHGLKATPHREYLLRILKASWKPLGAYEIKKMWKQADINIVTLYRALDAFVEAGLVRRIHLGRRHVDYEFIQPDSHEHHMVCKKCEMVEKFEGCLPREIERLALSASIKFASLQDHSLQLLGICRGCDA